MNRDPARTAQRPEGPDDEQLGALVRAMSDGWRLPPQRLDRPTWRDRVGGHAVRRRRRWLVRLAAPVTTAIVGTVIVAFVAVWLSAPRADRAIVGKAPSSSAVAPSGTSSPRPTASTLPVLYRDGDLPNPARVMVRSDGAYEIADLATGSIDTPAIGRHSGPTTLLARPGGGWLCICGDWIGSAYGQSPTRLDLSLESVDGSGAAVSRSALRSIRGAADPAVPTSSQVELVDAGTTGSPDGRYAFVAWSASHGASGWAAGIDVVDVATATVVSSTPLKVPEPTSAGGRPTIRIAPRVALAPSGDMLLVSSFWYVDDPSPTPPSGTDHWTASLDRSAIGSLVAAGSSAGERCGEFDSGLIDATTYYLLCWTPDGRLMFERERVDGKAVDRSEVPRTAGGLDRGSLVARQGDLLYLWDPIMARLTRFNLRSGVVDMATATAVVPSTGPLDAVASVGRRLGAWMAPSAMAKVFLEPALVVSADGTRIYAIGIDAPTGDGSGGSRGVFAFDASTFVPIAHWAATADFISLSISPDGRFLYAAGQAGRDAAGNGSLNAASITVFDTGNGSVRLIAGRLGSGVLLFPSPIAR